MFNSAAPRSKLKRLNVLDNTRLKGIPACSCLQSIFWSASQVETHFAFGLVGAVPLGPANPGLKYTWSLKTVAFATTWLPVVSRRMNVQLEPATPWSKSLVALKIVIGDDHSVLAQSKPPRRN